MIETPVPFPIGSLVLYKGQSRAYVYNLHISSGTHDLIHEKGRTTMYNVPRSDLDLICPAVTSCDWQKMLEALKKWKTYT